MNNILDSPEYKEARPLIRGAMAFLLGMRLGGGTDVSHCFAVADEFLDTIERTVVKATPDE